jgi:ribosomal protein S18 acetylase RimI-like enzyme
LIVAPARRGQGLGGRLVRLLVELARAAYPTIALRVAPDNVVAQRCYLRAGFVRASAEDEAEWNQGQPVEYVWMTR